MTDRTGQAAKPTFLVTGASGFIGRHFIDLVKDRAFIHAVARRSQADAGVPTHPGVSWVRADIGEPKSLGRAVDAIVAEGGVDFIFHFAGYYDYTDRDNPEYQRTNVDGTRYLLDHAVRLGARRFIYASSLAVSEFARERRLITEESPADSEIPYARSKRQAEDLVRQASVRIPCAIVRLAAIFSDWCEYGPLYALLATWTRPGLPGILVGRGETALPYLHVGDLCRLFLRIVDRHEELSSCPVLLASHDGAVSHRELFELVSRYGHGRARSPLLIPRWLAAIGVAARLLLGRIIGREPFERLWMLRYIDTGLFADAGNTRKILGWQPAERYRVGRRLLFMIENMRSNPALWRQKNEIMAHKAVQSRPGLAIYEAMLAKKAEVVDEVVGYLRSPANSDRFRSYQALDAESLHLRVSYLYDLFELVFLSGERRHMLCYSGYLARQRCKEGFSLAELSGAVRHTVEVMERVLLSDKSLLRHADRIAHEIGMTGQMMLDEIEETYLRLEAGGTADDEQRSSCPPDMWEI